MDLVLVVGFSKTRYDRSAAENEALQETSPFKNGTAEEHSAQIYHGKRQEPWMGVVHTEGGGRYFIRIKCQHMAEVQHEDAIDCRFGCQAQEDKERELRKRRGW